MIETFRPSDVKIAADNLRAFRASADEWEEKFLWEARRDLFRPRRSAEGIPLIGGGAPVLPVTLTTLKAASATVNTITGPSSIIAPEAVGPFSVDYFKTLGASWRQEASGVISCTATPTFALGTYFGTVIGTITTVLAITAAQTCISGLANVDWWYRVVGVTKAISGSTATMLVAGFLTGQIATAAANNIVAPAKNATPPTAVTTDLSSAVFIDLKATWSASSVSNQTTVNDYILIAYYN